MKRDNASAYVHMRRDTPSLYLQLYAFWMTPQSPHQLRMHLIDGPFLNQKHINTFEYCVYWNISIQKNKFLYEQTNGMVV